MKYICNAVSYSHMSHSLAPIQKQFIEQKIVVASLRSLSRGSHTSIYSCAQLPLPPKEKKEKKPQTKMDVANEENEKNLNVIENSPIS